MLLILVGWTIYKTLRDLRDPEQSIEKSFRTYVLLYLISFQTYSDFKERIEFLREYVNMPMVGKNKRSTWKFSNQVDEILDRFMPRIDGGKVKGVVDLAVCYQLL